MTLNTDLKRKLILYSAVILVTLTAVYFQLMNENSTEANTIKATSHIHIQKSEMDSSDNFNIFDFHFDNILVDTHNDFLWQAFYRGASFGNYSFPFHSDLNRFMEGGVDVQVFAVWIPMNRVNSSYTFVTQQINRLKQLESTYSSDFEIAYTHADILRIVDAGKLCGLIGVEGGTAIHSDIENVNRLHSMGVRYIGLTWNNSNNIASSARDEVERGAKGGLTEFGKRVVKRMDEVGIMVDVSHLGERAFWDLVETTKNPILASHSNVHAINPHFRNLTDDQIKAIARSGGVVQVSFHDLFLNRNAPGNRQPNAMEVHGRKLEELRQQSGGDLIKFNELRYDFLINSRTGRGTNIELLIDHIDHIVKLVGIDYVGLGSDYDGGISPPYELYDVTTYPVITKRLYERGYSKEDIKKIMGLNFLRVFKQVCG